MEYEYGIKLCLTVIFVSLLLSSICLRLIICMRLRIVLTKIYVKVYESIILLIMINFTFCTLQPHAYIVELRNLGVLHARFLIEIIMNVIDIYILFMFMEFSVIFYISLPLHVTRTHCQSVDYVKSNVYVGWTINIPVCLFMFNIKCTHTCTWYRVVIVRNTRTSCHNYKQLTYKVDLINVYIYNTWQKLYAIYIICRLFILVVMTRLLHVLSRILLDKLLFYRKVHSPVLDISYTVQLYCTYLCINPYQTYKVFKNGR